jgi:hypothetical protein
MNGAKIMTKFVRTIEGPLVNVMLAAKIITDVIGDGPARRITFIDAAGCVMGTCYGSLEQLHALLHEDAGNESSPPCVCWVH